MARNLFGAWAFLIGVVLAIVLGAMSALSEFVIYLLVAIGLVVGFLNITAKEVRPFLMAGTVLVIVSWLGAEVMVLVPVMAKMLNALLILFVPATIVVALRSVFALAKN